MAARNNFLQSSFLASEIPRRFDSAAHLAQFRRSAARQSDGKLLVEGIVTLACIGPALKAMRIPLEIRTMLETELGNAA